MTMRVPLDQCGLSAGKSARLHRILYRHGLQNGTALFLPYDQGREHGPRDFFANPKWVAAGALLLVHGGLHLTSFDVVDVPSPATGYLPGGVDAAVVAAMPMVTAALFAVAGLGVAVPRWRRTGLAAAIVASLAALSTFVAAAQGWLVAEGWSLPGVVVNTAVLALAVGALHAGGCRTDPRKEIDHAGAGGF
jgi:hypothetical protein